KLVSLIVRTANSHPVPAFRSQQRHRCFFRACSRYSPLASTSTGTRPEIFSTSGWIVPVPLCSRGASLVLPFSSGTLSILALSSPLVITVYLGGRARAYRI